MRFESRQNTQGGAAPVHVGSGVVGERLLTLPYAARVHVSAALSAVFRVDPECRDEITLRIRADDNLLKFVRAKLSDGVISIQLEPGVYVDPSELRVTATLGRVRELAASGVASVRVTNLIEPRITLSASGASRLEAEGAAQAWRIVSDGNSQIHLQLSAAEQVGAEVRAASELSLSGHARVLDLCCDGTARVHASMPEFLAQRARVLLEGLSRAEVCAQAGVSGRVRFPAQLSVAGGAPCEIEGSYRRA